MGRDLHSCCSTPLVVLGLLQGVNGVGVTQGMNILFHSPASLYVLVSLSGPLGRLSCMELILIVRVCLVAHACGLSVLLSH